MSYYPFFILPLCLPICCDATLDPFVFRDPGGQVSPARLRLPSNYIFSPCEHSCTQPSCRLFLVLLGKESRGGVGGCIFLHSFFSAFCLIGSPISRFPCGIPRTPFSKKTQPAFMIEPNAPDLHRCSSLCLCMVLLFLSFNLMARFAGSKMRRVIMFLGDVP